MQSPAAVRTEEDALRKGINCITLAHLALNRLFGYTLPSELHFYELYNDTEHLVTLDSGAPEAAGDLVWFGRATPAVPFEAFTPDYDADGDIRNWQDCPLTHVAVYTGETVGEDPLLLHATHHEGTNTIWPMSRFADYPAYERVYRISRLATEAAVTAC